MRYDLGITLSSNSRASAFNLTSIYIFKGPYRTVGQNNDWYTGAYCGCSFIDSKNLCIQVRLQPWD